LYAVLNAVLKSILFAIGTLESCSAANWIEARIAAARNIVFGSMLALRVSGIVDTTRHSTYPDNAGFCKLG